MENLKRSWENSYSLFWQNFDDCFSYSKTISRAHAYVRGLLATVERKNGWQLAEFIGDVTPYAIQNFLSRAIWSADDVRDKILRVAKEYILSDSDQGYLIVDETGFLKKGTHSAGVKRQYSGTAGRIENSQIGVFLALAGTGGQALIDRELYLSKEWCEDKIRCKKVDIPENTNFQTKHQLAIKMLDRAFQHGLKPCWVLADALYGSSYEFRKFLLDKNQPYVLAVSRQQIVTINFNQWRVDKFVNEIGHEEWKRLSCGSGTKGKRLCEWYALKLCWPASEGMAQYLMIRKNINDSRVSGH